eukprot:TRINITY_DN49244_c0_g1_i1.p1 TRINITY_DN49244_c0_g1~~TRINITY_DN49244_c0_g1_i1.p1  ORF type:complete len:261 (+),score=53.11 TRINITY_DN49244_c0_g1_i1:33-785(+)
MAPVPDLDEELHARILAYVTEPRASVSCQAWKKYLYEALKLEPRIRFMQRLAEEGRVTYCYNAVRPLGEDFEESVGYSFNFAADGTYRLMWTRTFDAWSSQCEQHFGRWHVFMDYVACETTEPLEEASEREVRYAPPGYRFAVAIEDILSADGGFFQAKDGARAKDWELPARLGKLDEEGSSVRTAGMWEPIQASSSEAAGGYRAPIRSDARFVEIDGEMHEVSGDIVANWPQEEWARLMRCRLRFGISG